MDTLVGAHALELVLLCSWFLRMLLFLTIFFLFVFFFNILHGAWIPFAALPLRAQGLVRSHCPV